MKTEQIAEIINRRKLHVRKDGQPVTSAQVYAVVMRNTQVFCYVNLNITSSKRRAG